MAERQVTFGILIRVATDAAKAGFKSVAGAATAMAAGIRGAASLAKSAFSGIASGVQFAAHGMQVAHRVLNVLRQGFQTFIAPALEARAATDQQRKDFEALVKAGKELAILIGDILLPILLGIADAFGASTKGANAFIKANRELIGTKLVDWLARVATLLTQGVGQALIYVSRIWYGWNELIAVLKGAFEEWFALVFAGFEKWLSIGVKIYDTLGADGIAGQLETARQYVANLSAEFDKAGDESFEALNRIVNEQEALEAGINSVTDAVVKGIGQAQVAAYKRLAQEIAKATQATEDLFKKEQEYLKSRKEAFGALRDSVHRFYEEEYKEAEESAEQQKRLSDAVAEYKTANLERVAEQEERNREAITAGWEEVSSAVENISADLTSTFKDAFSDIGRLQNETSIKIVKNEEGLLEEQEVITKQHVKNTGDAVKQVAASIALSVAQEALKVIVAKAAEAAAGAFSAHAGIPYVGLAIGAAAAAAASAAVLAFGGGFNQGGIVGGGGPNRDSVLIAATPGEAVIDRDTTSGLIRALGGASTAPAAPQQSSAGHRLELSTPHTIAAYTLYGPPNSTQLDKIERDTVAPRRRRLSQLGYMVS